MRPIDADALNAAIEKWFDGVCVYDVAPFEAVNDFQSIVDEQPTVSPDDARGVGKWLDTPYAIECSKCHEEFDSEVACCDIYGWPWKFCPKCGARMTEVSEYV